MSAYFSQIHSGPPMSFLSAGPASLRDLAPRSTGHCIFLVILAILRSIGLVRLVRRMPARCMLFAPGQGKEESRALIYLRLRPHRATMFADYSVHCGESHAGPFKFLRAMQPLEHAE